MNILVFFAVILCFIGSVSAQIVSFGSCPNVTVKENFQLNEYLGRWYENRRFFAAFEAFSDCVTAEYSLLEDGSVKVNNTGINRLIVLIDGGRSYTSMEWLSRKNTDRISTAIGNAAPGKDIPAKLTVRFSASAPEGDYWVLATDYDTYSVVWSCTDLGFLNLQFGWVLTRAAEGLTQEKIRELYSEMDKFKIDTHRFSITNQLSCNREQHVKF